MNPRVMNPRPKRIENVEYVELVGSKMLEVKHKGGSTYFHLVNDDGTIEG